MKSSQWIGLALFVLLLLGLAYAFVRKGSNVKPDKSHDPGTLDWGDHGGHGSESSGH